MFTFHTKPFSFLASDELKAFFATAKDGEIRLIKIGIENGRFWQ